MNLSRVAHPSHGRCDLVTDSQVSTNCGRNRNFRSTEIISSDRFAGSDYSDAGDTFPSYSTADDSDAVSSPHHGHQDVVASREFILKRFLPAAQAMTTTDRKQSAPTSTFPSQRRSAPVPKYSSCATRTSSQPLSFDSASSRSKSRFIHEVKQDVTGFSDDEDEEERFSAVCGFPLHLGRLATLPFRCNSFWTSSRPGCRGSSAKARSTPHKVESVKAVVQYDSDNSDDLFWSDEEVFEDAIQDPELNATPCSETRKLPFAAPPARLHSMETVHTPDHRGFLGVPNRSKSGELEQTRQVDRLGTRLSRIISKTNYMEPEPRSCNIRHVNVQCEGAGPDQSPSATQKSSGSKWVDAFASLRPPPSPKMPSESWLSNTLSPERFLRVKNLHRKPLRSFIPIKPTVKPPSHEEESDNLLRQVRQTCSLKEHLHGRQIQSPSLQAV